jgi:hypothetical protein
MCFARTTPALAGNYPLGLQALIRSPGPLHTLFYASVASHVATFHVVIGRQFPPNSQTLMCSLFERSLDAGPISIRCKV